MKPKISVIMSVYNGETYTINGDVKRWKGAANLSNIQLNLAKWEG